MLLRKFGLTAIERISITARIHINHNPAEMSDIAVICKKHRVIVLSKQALLMQKQPMLILQFIHNLGDASVGSSGTQ